MGVPATATLGDDFLRERAAKMRESLQKSQTITDNVVTILGSFDHRLSALETAMRPTQVCFLFGSIEKSWGRMIKSFLVEKFYMAGSVFLVDSDQLNRLTSFLLCENRSFWFGIFVSLLVSLENRISDPGFAFFAFSYSVCPILGLSISRFLPGVVVLSLILTV